jgi:heptosyltransferase II
VIRPFERILIRGTSWIGDSVVSIPALRELRRIFPSSEIVLLVKPWVRDAFLDADFIDGILVHENGFPGTLDAIQKIRKSHFDAAILFQNAFIAAALAYSARIPVRIGFPTDHRRLLLTHPLDLAKSVRQSHQIYYYLSIASKVEELVFHRSRVDFQAPDFSLLVSDTRKAKARTYLQELGLDLTRKLIAVNPGATNSRAKQWPADRFIQIGDRLAESGNCHVLLVGASSEKQLGESIAKRMHHNPILLTGRTTLAESIAILSLCDLVLSNDTGPAYLSAALGRPTLTIFGPTNFNMICPTSDTAHIVRAPIHCAPCMLRDCTTNHECMKAVTVDMVYREAKELLLARPAPRADCKP